MKGPSINLSFSAYSDASLLAKANQIIASMTDNPFFPPPVPPLALVQELAEIYSVNLTAAANLGRVKVAEKNQSRLDLEKALGNLGRFVLFTANEDVNTLVSSGYTISKEPQPRHLDNPGNVTLGNGITTGTMTSSVKKGNATSYSHEITETLPTEETVWTKYPTNTRQFVFTDLTPGKQYWVRVAAVGFRNQVAYSNMASLFVQ